MSDPDAVAAAAARRAATGAAGSAAGFGYGAAGSAVGRAASTYTPPPYQPPIRTTATGQYTKPMSVPMQAAGAIPDIGAYLNADTAYQNQLRQFAQALSDMQADVTRRRGSLTSNYDTSVKAMADQRLKDLSNMEADYGARGLLRSGLYAKAQGDYETEYNNRATQLSQQETDALAQLDQQLNQFQSQQGLQSQAAREEAIRRRAEQYGV